MTSNEALLDSAAQLLDAHIGLKSDPSFRPRLARALRDLAHAKSIDQTQLVGALARDTSLLDGLVERVTVQETAFFRHPEQFEHIRRELLPRMHAPVLAWSAACSNGQEAYSLAMLLAETCVAGSILASDISHSALRRTSTGRYHEREMRGISDERRQQHFAPAGEGWQAKPGLRNMVRVELHNLVDPIPQEVAACQLVMCRNVLIYFTQSRASAFLERLADMMRPDAYLFVGGAETLWQLTDRFEPIQSTTGFVYRPRSSGRRARLAIASTTVAAVSAIKPSPVPVSLRPAALRSTDAANASDQHTGPALLASGRTNEAVVAFRQRAYLAPDDPTAHFHLGLALDDAGESVAARRAYRVAIAALDRSDQDAHTSVLHGFDRAELRRLLQHRCLTTTESP
jgi:chemotaxis protein methyltransferase CheR